jgi:chemotaxis protein methyltransferase CheR
MTPGLATAFASGAGPVHERVRALTGLVFPESRMGALRTGLEKGMKRAGTGDPETYLSRLAVEPALLDDLVAEITVGETYFFRDTPQCRVIRDRVLPALLHGRTHGPLRIWSAGCATGEEAYTLAILHADSGAPEPARIVGTDLSRPALARARRGRYGKWALRGLTPEEVARYFRPSESGFVLRPDLVGDVEFRYLNLVEDAYPSLASGSSGMDLILCRNVLIYFDGETAVHVIRRLMDSLAPDGWLLLGASDPHPADPAPCEVVVTEAGLAYRRSVKGARAIVPTGVPAPRPDGPLRPPPPWVPTGSLPPPPAVATPGESPAAGPTLPAPAPPAATAPAPSADLQAAVTGVRALANAGDLHAAGGACAAALDVHRTSAELTYLHGVLLVEAGRVAEAAAAFRACLYLDRTLAVAHLALGGSLLRLGDPVGARRALQSAERLLASQPPDAQVPASDGERAGRLVAAARAHLALLSEVAP